MPDEGGGLGTDVVEQCNEIGGESVAAIGVDGERGRRCSVAPLVGDEHPPAGLGQRLDLVTPGV